MRRAVTEAYIEAYKRANNGDDPQKAYQMMKEGRPTEKYDVCDARNYENFLEDLCIKKIRCGTVEWV